MTKSIKSLVVFCLLLGAFSLSAQTTNGKLSFSAGIGVLPTFLNDDVSVNTPPVSIRLAYQASPIFQLSGYAGYTASTSNSPFIISDGQSSLISNKQLLVGLRGELRKEVGKKFDVYGGGMLGFLHSSTREFDKNTNETIVREIDGPTPYDPNQPKGRFNYSGFVGTTYYFTKGVGIFAEAGYGVSLLNTGVTIKL
ncbi:MAG: outer membrane beta-barrel protein [Saprospiraceae bacterium]